MVKGAESVVNHVNSLLVMDTPNDDISPGLLRKPLFMFQSLQNLLVAAAQLSGD